MAAQLRTVRPRWTRWHRRAGRRVSDRLKAPSTAEFGEASTVVVGVSTYKVTGVVDAENGFGAMIRARYICQVRYDGDDVWTAESVSLLE